MAKYWLYAERSEAKNFLGYVAFRRVFKKMPYATSYTPPLMAGFFRIFENFRLNTILYRSTSIDFRQISIEVERIRSVSIDFDPLRSN